MSNFTPWPLAKSDKDLVNHIKTRKLGYFRHVIRQSQDSIENSMVKGLVEGKRSLEKEAWDN